MGKLRILHSNDFHGKLTPSRLPFLLQHRAECDLYFDSGDCINAGNLAIPLKPDPVWPLLSQAGVTATVPGNRESHVLEAVVNTKVSGSQHPILCANWFRNDDQLRFQESLILDYSDLRIGILGLMVPMVTERMASRKASQFVWTNPISQAKSVLESLRPKVDLLVALTHIGFTQDQLLAAACPEIDIILGGHSHTVLEQPEMVGKTAICQTGSHGRYLGILEWDGLMTSYNLIPWEER